MARVTMMRAAPSRGWSSSTAKPARNGTYTATSTVASRSRWYPAGPSASRHTIAASTVRTSPTGSASAPANQASTIITPAPPNSGTSGARGPPSCASARTISQIATAAAAAITKRNAGRRMSSDTSTTAPRPAPTPIAAGRLRPARPVPVGGAGTSGGSRSSGGSSGGARSSGDTGSTGDRYRSGGANPTPGG